MHFPCPDTCDVDDVHALNRDFLSSLLAGDDPAALQNRLVALSAQQRQTLAEAPFLLYSLGDSRRWQRAFDDAVDLLDDATPPQWASLTATTIAFLWHLSKRDPHSARLYSGVSTAFCRRLASEPLIRITQRALEAGIAPRLRRRMDISTYLRLIDDSHDRTRTSRSRIAAMQRVLLVESDGETRLPSAACAIDFAVPGGRRVSASLSRSVRTVF